MHFLLKRAACLLAAALLCATTLVAQGAPAELGRRLAAMEGVSDVKPLDAGEYAEKYELFVEQPLDWADPAAGSFRHRIYVMHVGFDRPTVVVTEGYGAGYASNPRYREELSRIFDANVVFVEHRYFLESTPSPRDWRYLTAENSACDLHDVVTRMKSLYPGKWIATGISKGGTTTMLYATFFPDDVDVWVPYVGPVNRAREDGRHEKFLRRVGTPEERARIEAFQTEALKRRERLMPRFEAFCREKGYAFRIPVEEVYDFCVLEYAFSLWQWGTPVDSVPSPEVGDDELFTHLVSAVDPDYFVRETPTTSFFVQAARELGYYGYDTKPFRKYLCIDTSKDYLRRIFVPDELREMPFDKTLYRKMKRFLRREDPKMVMIYGGIDPWTASGAWWAATPRKKNMKAYIQEGGSHRTRIGTFPEATQREIVDRIAGWLAE